VLELWEAEGNWSKEEVSFKRRGEKGNPLGPSAPNPSALADESRPKPGGNPRGGEPLCQDMPTDLGPNFCLYM